MRQETASQLIKKASKNIEKEIGHIKDNAKLHSDQDFKNFGEIHIRLNDIVTMLKEQNESTAPMLKIFNDNKITKAVLSKNGKMILTGSTALAALYGAWHILLNIFKS